MFDLLVLAFNLAALTYYIGCLLYVLPIPLSGLKKWAPTLISDAALSMILVAGFRIIIWIVNYLSSILNANWDGYLTWLTSLYGGIGVAYLVLRFLGYLASVMPYLKFAQPIIGWGLSLTSTMITSYTALYVLSLFILANFTMICAIGIALFAVPFRFTRAAGAMLMSFALIFYIGLPLLPKFVNIVTSSTIVADLNKLNMTVTYPEGYVNGRLGPLNYGLLEFYTSKSYDSESLVAAYLIENSGKYTTKPPDGGLPPEDELYPVLNLYGHLFFGESIKDLKLCLLSTSYCNINISIPGLVIANEYLAIHMDLNATPIVYESNNHRTWIIVKSINNTCDIYITVPISYIELHTLRVNSTHIELSKLRSYSWDWDGISGRTYILTLKPGIWNISVTYTSETIMTPSLQEKYYFKELMGTGKSDVLFSLINIVSLLFVITTLLPTLYVSLLLVAAYGMAKILGGGKVKIPVI